MKITKQWLKKHNACSEGIKAFCKQKETDSTKILKLLIKSNEKEKLEWANWLIVKLFRNNKQRISYVIFVAKLVLNIFEEKYPGDLRPRKAIEAAEKCLKNPSQKNRVVAAYAADAYSAASAAYDASAYSAASAAYDAYSAASAANAADDYNKTLIKILKYGLTLL